MCVGGSAIFGKNEANRLKINKMVMKGRNIPSTAYVEFYLLYSSFCIGNNCAFENLFV